MSKFQMIKNLDDLVYGLKFDDKATSFVLKNCHDKCEDKFTNNIISYKLDGFKFNLQKEFENFRYNNLFKERNLNAFQLKGVLFDYFESHETVNFHDIKCLDFNLSTKMANKYDNNGFIEYIYNKYDINDGHRKFLVTRYKKYNSNVELFLNEHFGKMNFTRINEDVLKKVMNLYKLLNEYLPETNTKKIVELKNISKELEFLFYNTTENNINNFYESIGIKINNKFYYFSGYYDNLQIIELILSSFIKNNEELNEGDSFERKLKIDFQNIKKYDNSFFFKHYDPDSNGEPDFIVIYKRKLTIIEVKRKYYRYKYSSFVSSYITMMEANYQCVTKLEKIKNNENYRKLLGIIKSDFDEVNMLILLNNIKLTGCELSHHRYFLSRKIGETAVCIDYNFLSTLITNNGISVQSRCYKNSESYVSLCCTGGLNEIGHMYLIANNMKSHEFYQYYNSVIMELENKIDICVPFDRKVLILLSTDNLTLFNENDFFEIKKLVKKLGKAKNNILFYAYLKNGKWQIDVGEISTVKDYSLNVHDL